MISYKFRMYPNKQQTEKLDFALDICRQAYNIMLGELRDQAIIDRNMIQSILPDLKICEPRFREGNVKQVTLKRMNDKWFAFVISDGKTRLKHGDKVLGIDLGINHYLVDSEGNKVEHPKNYERMLPKLKMAHRNLSKKKKGSKNRLKAKKSLNRIYEKVNNQRNNFLHKTSTDLIRQCKVIVVEDLNIKGMMEQRYFNAKNITDSSWNKFIQMLEYKSENSGVQLIKVNPKNTTKTC